MIPAVWEWDDMWRTEAQNLVARGSLGVSPNKKLPFKGLLDFLGCPTCWLKKLYYHLTACNRDVLFLLFTRNSQQTKHQVIVIYFISAICLHLHVFCLSLCFLNLIFPLLCVSLGSPVPLFSGKPLWWLNLFQCNKNITIWNISILLPSSGGCDIVLFLMNMFFRKYKNDFQLIGW